MTRNARTRNVMTRNYVKAGLLACISLPLLATSAERLNIKLGLWEITAVTQMSGMPPLPRELLDKLTPQQRATMAAEANTPDKDTNRECITAKDLEQPFQAGSAKSCKQSIVATTRTTQEVRFICSGEQKGSGVLRISTPTPETMSGTMDLKFGEGADAFTIKGRLSGRWLSADCGDETEDDSEDSTEQSNAADEPSDDDEEEEE